MSVLHEHDSKPAPIAKIGSIAPDFTLKTDRNEDWNLADHLGGVTVLLFYPQNETMVCTKQLCSVRDNWEHYLETKATIVGVSPASPEAHKTFARNRQLPIPLLADPDREVTRTFTHHRFYPISFTRAVVVIDARGIVRTRDVMLRAFRPSDEQIITDIYKARGDAMNDKYNKLRHRIQN